MFKIQPLAGIQGVVQHTGMSTCELACSRVSPVRTREGRLCTIPVTTCAMAALFIMPANALRMHAIRDHGQLSMAALELQQPQVNASQHFGHWFGHWAQPAQGVRATQLNCGMKSQHACSSLQQAITRSTKSEMRLTMVCCQHSWQHLPSPAD